MAVFKMGKDFDEVQDAKMMPEDWYVAEISKEVEYLPNNKMKEGGVDAPGAGYNYVINLRSVNEDPELNGRMLTMWLMAPGGDDANTFFNGRSKEDEKMERIARVVAAFQGIEDWTTLSGDEIEFVLGARAQVYVTMGLGKDGQTPQNSIDIFNLLPKPVDS